jgi:hypothetical protein
MTALDRLADMPRWVAWRTEDRNGKATKNPAFTARRNGQGR